MLRYLIVVCILFSTVVSAGSLQKSDIVGSWIVSESGNPTLPAKLTVYSDFSASFKNSFSSHADEYRTAANALRKFDGVWVVKFTPKNQNTSYKLFFSGWKNRKTKSMFGVLYVYQYGVLNNGLSVSFDQSSLP